MDNKKLFGYWNYYSENFNWNEEAQLKLVDKEHTLNIFKDNGFNEERALKLWNSGYVGIEGFDDIIIDRYYGGPIRSYDTVSRFPPSQLNELFEKPKSNAWIKTASSIEQLNKIVEEAQKKSSKPILFRGQGKNYFIDREINNPYFTIDGLGEISMLSSFWRKVFFNTKTSFLDFETLTLLEWSKIFYTAFDLKEIERRQKKALDNGEWMHTMQDMADSDDPLLKEFGNHRLDISMGKSYNLADTLSTLLQHYGLLSTVIDLTSSLDVALFFATHKYSTDNGKSTYNFVGTNNGQSVIYLIRNDGREMTSHCHDRVLDKIPPLRPELQSCYISRSSSLAVNLPTFFLEGVIFLDFELKESEMVKKVNDLFPSEEDDKFLKAIKEGIIYPEKVTYF